ncbi:MAG: hypothetical protein ACREAY_03855 [Nitrososphaera sp.]|uniref:hypothetical protein n=1 Tax=Nitrososphaera sp. TaxID=1971748 RepID=UPI003D6FC8A7
MQFRHVLALGIIFGVTSITPHAAYGHGCQAQGWGCFTPWPTAILSSYSEVTNIVSAVGMILIVAMIIFKFDYLQRSDFYAVRYSPAANRLDRLLFKGRDKRKIIAAMPFLIFGGYLAAAGLYSMFAFDNLRNVDFAIMVAVFALPHHRRISDGIWPQGNIV